MKAKHRIKRKPNYEILIIPDKSSSGVKKYNLPYAGRVFGGVLLTVVIAGLAVYIGYMNYHTIRYRQNEEYYTETIDKLTEENKELRAETENQANTIHILSTTVNKKVEAEAEYTAEAEEKKKPNAIPLSGTMIFPEYKDEVLMPDGLRGEMITRPLFEFAAENGTIVMATGEGIVTEVTEEMTYGYQVVVDHGNGYETIYRAKTEPNVNVGDTVPQGGTIYVLMSGNKDEEFKLGHQIRLNGEFVDPGTVLKIEG